MSAPTNWRLSMTPTSTHQATLTLPPPWARRALLVTSLWTLVLGPAGCSSASFSGAGKSTVENVSPAAPKPKICVDGDKANVAWSGAAKECIVDQGGTYNFALEKCATMRRAPFECSWATVTTELAKL